MLDRARVPAPIEQGNPEKTFLSGIDRVADRGQPRSLARGNDGYARTVTEITFTLTGGRFNPRRAWVDSEWVSDKIRRLSHSAAPFGYVHVRES
jgi:hypothetical protein